MSVPNHPVIQDDDGPEEGEIEDDEDDIILLDGSSPHRSSTTSTSLDVYSVPTGKDSYERDIRHFELRRSRTSRRRTSGAAKSTYSTGSSIRSKTKNSRAGLTEGKENRHVHRHTSPPHIHRHRKESSENALADFKDFSPLRRDSSCSSIDSDERPTDRAPYYRSTRKATSKTLRGKRRSSSSPESYIPSKRRSHHSEKCPLMKVLHSVAKETRLIAMENSESHSESSSLRQRLLNMGAMPSINEEVHSKDKKETSFTLDTNPSIENSTNIADSSKQVQNGSTQTEGSPSLANKPVPEIVILTDGEEIDSNEQNISKKSNFCSNNATDQGASISDTSMSVPFNSERSNSVANSENDEDDDLSHLRLLALQSKKHEPSPPEDADVLQLRLAALKTAFIKKLKIRKKITIKINSISSKEDPLSPLDEIPIPLSVPSPDEVMTPVDMELAETDDEDASVDSIVHYSPSDPIPDCYSPSDPIPDHFSSPNPYPECYSPSDPTGSPILESSLQDLLPPPPPPDLDLLYTDPTLDTTFQNHVYHTGNISNSGYEQSNDVLALPPLPPYFQQLLSEPSEQCVDAFITGEGNLGSVEEVECCSLDAPSIEIRPNLIEIPVVSDVELQSCEFPPVKHSCAEGIEARKKEEEEEQGTIPVAESIPDSNLVCTLNISKATGTEDQTEITITRKVSLEEEEKMLRQRLLLNMARKKKNLPKQEKIELESVSGKNQALPKTVSSQTVPPKVQSSKRPQIKTSSSKPVSTVNTESTILRRSTTPVLTVPTTSAEKRLIVNLGEDSDSCEDYSEAEALGQKCTENKEKWLLHLKELEVNPPKMISPSNKLVPVIRGKAPSRASIKSKQPIRDKNGKKPFAQNLADLESSVERFLKGVRTSQEAIINSKSTLGLKTIPSSGTPVAVKHLPASQQEEYRRLKQQIATLEKQRRIPVEQKQTPQIVQKNTTMIPKNTKLIDKGSSKVVPFSNSRSKLILDDSTPNKDSKAVSSLPPSAVSLKQPVLTSTLKIVKAGPPQTPLNVRKVTAPQTSSEPVKVAVSINSNQTDSTKISCAIPAPKGKTALANVSNLSVTSLSNPPKPVLETKLIKSNKAVASNPSSLSSLEENLILERSHVLCELSALAKLLSQVDQSLEAQSQTAGEVSSLIDKLCLAAGRWKAQNVTVTHLVQKVAQRQRELSLRHRRCVALSKSCSQLGSEQIGKNYRSPGDKADAMHLQLKQVHEKTQDLAKRKTAERARRNVLERRAEDCLIKLFSDTSSEILKTTNQDPAQTSTSKASPLENPRVIPSTSQIPPHGSLGSLSDGVPSPSAQGMIALKVDCPRQVNPAMISKALSMRLALNKVRYAKATLNFASKRSYGRRPELKFKRRYVNTRASSLDARQDLSDMDISTDGEEAEKRNKLCSGNTEVVDMLVSPSSSLSPPETDLMNPPSEGTHESVDQNARCSKNIVGFESYYDDIPVDVSSTSIKSNLSSVLKQTTPLKKHDSRNNEPRTSRTVLKDYVSPLSGLNVFSSSSEEKFKEGDLDLYAILCPYDLNGKCEDKDCQYKHQHRQ